MKDVGAVVVTHNSEKHIEGCIHSLSERGIQEIVVVDSASRDRTREIVSSLPTRLVPLSENKGFGAAANKGLSALSTPYGVLLNPDALMRHGEINEALEYMRQSPDVAILGFLLRDAFGNIETSSWGDQVSPLSLVSRRFSQYPAVPSNPMSVGWVSGGAMMVRVKDILDTGGFDEAFFLYWEDVDLCRRIKESGKKIVLYPNVVVEHARGASLENQKHKTRLYDESADRYFQKHYATPIWLLHRLLRRIYRLFSPLVQ